MKTTKDIATYFEKKFPDFKETLADCSKENNGNAIVSNSPLAFNFDKISEQLFSNKLTSVDCIFFKDKFVDFIEFKGGLIDRTDTTFKDPKYSCENCNKLHREGFKFILKGQKHLKKVMHQNIQLKISESLYLLLNSILPFCNTVDKSYRLRFVLVFEAGKIDPVEEYEILSEDLSKQSKNKLNALLRKYACSDAQGNKIFFEDVKIYTNQEFNNLPFYQQAN